MDDNHSKEIHEHLEKVLDRQLAWIQAADGKAAVILPMSIAMIGAIAAVSPTEACLWNLLSSSITAVTVALIVSSVILLGTSMFPRTSGPASSVIYFGAISSKPIESYKNDVLNFCSSQYTDDLINQVYRNAQIARAKHDAVKKSMILLYLSILPWASTIYIEFDLGNTAWR